MAIWDKKEKTTTLSADSRKCLNCGDNLKFFVEEGYLKCVSCGSEFSPEIFEISEALEEKIEHEIDFNSEKEDEITRFFKENHQEIICNSCGSVVVTGKNTISTFCSFCGSPAVIGRRIQKEFLPDGIIPFKVSREDAEKSIRKWAKECPDVPFSFLSHAKFEKMTAIYVPFWLVDAECEMNVSGSCYRYDAMTSTYEEYFVRRNGTFPMQLVPFDGSKRIPDTLMEAIEPYDYSELAEFNDSYLNGVYAERYDQSPSDLAPRIANRFRDYMYELAKELTDDKKYTTFNLKNNYSTASKYKCYYALLPVWYLHYKYKGNECFIAVNGQTGEASGRLPESKFRSFLAKLKVYNVAIVPIVAYFVFMMAVLVSLFLLMHQNSLGEAFADLIVWITFIMVSGGVALLGAFNKRLKAKYDKKHPVKKLDSMPDPFTYIDRANMEIKKRTDDYIGTVELEENKRGRNLYRLINSKR